MGIRVLMLPRSPHALGRVDWEERARKWGIDWTADREPEPVEGEPIPGGADFHERVGCEGTFRLTSQDGPIWEATCDRCRAVFTLSASRVDPQLRQEGLLAHACLAAVFCGRPFQRSAENGPVLAQLRKWLSGYDPEQGVCSLLPAPALFGLQGRGKSHLLVVTCERVIAECELRTFFCSARGLLRDLQRFDDDVVRGAAWEKATSCDLLALDDLGAERGTDWQADQLAELIDHRYQSERPIVVATNYAPADWELMLDARSVSRLKQLCFPLELKGEDRRLRGAA